MKITLYKVANEGARIPRGYGIAWYSVTSTTATCYPIPLNWIARWLRDLWLFLQRGPVLSKMQKECVDWKAAETRRIYGQMAAMFDLRECKVFESGRCKGYDEKASEFESVFVQMQDVRRELSDFIKKGSGKE